MSKRFFLLAFCTGLAAVLWVGFGFIGASWLALAMTTAIAAAYLLGACELHRFRAGTAALAASLDPIPQPLPDLDGWLERVPLSLRHSVRLRIEGERGGGLPGPALTPYLVGLLVMLGMLGTFLGMVITFQGAVFALEGSTDLQAIRSALAAPLRGLGLSFGTSVAGVAASAMLGLMSAISRRERLEVARRLDERIATVLLPFSLVHQRQETFRALRAQARSLPDVGEQLVGLMGKIEERGAQLDARLLERHDALQRDMTQAYGELARRVGESLQESLAAGARSAGESITPVVESAMARMAADAERMHARLHDAASRQLERDNRALQERGDLLERLATLVQSAEGQAAKAAEAAAQVGNGALEVASLAESFGSAVQRFQAGSDKLADSLQRVEASLLRSTARSDEQLAYYVAQAREVIDLSITSQQAVLEGMRRLEAPPARVRA